MTVLKSKYLTTVRRRLSQLAIEKSDSPIDRPSVVRSDIRILLQAITHGEEEQARLAAELAQVREQAETEWAPMNDEAASRVND